MNIKYQRCDPIFVPDKTLGYILVPLYLEMTTGESIEEAVTKADFGEVWNVLQALQEQDEVLADIIRQMQEDKGKYGKQRSNKLGDKVETLGIDISLNALRESITALCIEKLGFTWDLRYGELMKYKEQFGDCNVPQGRSEVKQLATWVHSQRKSYLKNKLDHDRIKRLEDIGFLWTIKEELYEKMWEEMFEALIEYKIDHGNCNIPSGWAKNKKLANWVRTQRGLNLNNKLDNDYIKRLEDIGFVWNAIESSWKKMLDALKEYKKKCGHCNVPLRWEVNKQLGHWVIKQRIDYKNGNLADDRIKCLEDIGFVWNLFESRWEEMFKTLIEYKKDHGDCNVPFQWKKNKPLANWAQNQRNEYLSNKLDKDRIKRLEDIGFVWKKLASNKEEMFEALIEYKKDHGNCNVPSRWTGNKQLASWVGRQRNNYQEGKLSKESIKRLEDIGFLWTSKEELDEKRWEEMLEVLKEYKEEYGNCNVPSRWAKNKQLGTWVSNQRASYRKGKLDKERIKRLENICFAWKRHESQ